MEDNNSKNNTLIYIPIEENQDKKAKTSIPKVEKWMFFLGFIVPLAWFIGSSYCGDTRPDTYIWKKRCRIATTLYLTTVIVMVAVVMVIKPDLFGLRTDYTSGAQTSLGTDSAIRPGVPVTGASNWGDVVAGLSISDLQ